MNYLPFPKKEPHTIGSTCITYDESVSKKPKVHRRTWTRSNNIVNTIISTQKIKQDRIYYTDIRLWVFLNDRREQTIPVRFTIVSRRTKESDSIFLSTNILDLKVNKMKTTSPMVLK